MKRTFYIILLFLNLSVAFSQALPVSGKDLKKLSGVLAGEWDSNDQADADKAFFHVVMRFKPVWTDKKDGYWFYVEQAVTSSQHLPYRQRIYHLFLHDDQTIATDVYELKNPGLYVGAWKDDALLAAITPDSLLSRERCSVYLQQVEKGVYKGSTAGKECLSSLRNAAYATSEVTISRERMISWDRGWNDLDQQVWGAEKGGYVFLKRKKFK